MKRYLFVLLLIATILCAAKLSFAATESKLSFSWTVESAETISNQGITELRVYKDTYEAGPVGTATPESGIISIETSIDGCSNFWATYSTLTEESERTDPPIKVCEPNLGNPLPATQVMSVNGFTVTVEFKPNE